MNFKLKPLRAPASFLLLLLIFFSASNCKAAEINVAFSQFVTSLTADISYMIKVGRRFNESGFTERVPVISKYLGEVLDPDFGKGGTLVFTLPGIANVNIVEAKMAKGGLLILGEAIAADLELFTQVTAAGSLQAPGFRETGNFYFIAQLDLQGRQKWMIPVENVVPRPLTSAAPQTSWSWLPYEHELASFAPMGTKGFALISRASKIVHHVDRVFLVNASGNAFGSFGKIGFMRLTKRFKLSSLVFHKPEERIYYSGMIGNDAALFSSNLQGDDLARVHHENLRAANSKVSFNPYMKRLFIVTGGFRLDIVNLSGPAPIRTRINLERYMDADYDVDVTSDESGSVLTGWHKTDPSKISLFQITAGTGSADTLTPLRSFNVGKLMRYRGLCEDLLEVVKNHYDGILPPIDQ